MKSTGFTWPVLVDAKNETERAYGTQISLSNIYQWYVVAPDGQYTRYGGGEAQAIAGVDRLLPQAKFLFDGIEIPAKLKPLADEIEFGTYTPHIATVASLAQKGPKSIKAAAAAMFEKLKPMAESGIERAKAFEGEGRKFAAYREYERVAAWFKKTDYEKTASKAISALKRDKDVKKELSAQKLLARARAMLGTGKKRDAQQGVAICRMIEKKYAGTETAKEAEALRRSATP